MGNVLFFDTETNGLPANFKAPATDLDNWPRIVQLAYAVYTPDGELVKEVAEVIRPDGWKIPPDMIHGISHEFAESHGVDLAPVLDGFLDELERAEFLVAHNLRFDENVMLAEAIRAMRSGKIRKRNKIMVKKVCTMLRTVEVCRIEGPYGKYKWPKLEELYYYLFREGFDGAHDAGADVRADARCFFELVLRGDLKI